jgi:hypothetical protein
VKRYASTIVLVLVAIVLGVYLWLDKGSVSNTEKKMRENDVFTAWRREDLSRVDLEHEKDKTTLVRENDEWRMSAPIAGAVDAALVDRFLGTLEFATVVRKVSGDVAGFDRPRARGAIVMGAVTYRFELGPDAPSPEGASYFRFVGEKPIVVGKELAEALMKGPDAFRARTLVPYLSLDLAKLEVFGRANAFTLERLGPAKDAGIDDRPFVVKDLGLRASRDRLDKVWRAFAEMRAEAFLADADADKALGESVVTITMTPKGGRPAGILVVGGKCPSQADDVVVVRRAPERASACAPKGVVDALSVSQRSLVDTQLFSLHDDEIEALRIEASPTGAVLDLARKGGGWHERAPVDRDLPADEAEAATALVSSLARAEGKVLGRDARRALTGSLRARVTVTRADTGEEETVELADAGGEDDSSLVFRRADAAIVEVDPRVARLLVPRLTSLRPRALFAEPIAGKPVASLLVRCNGAEQRVTKDGASYRLTVDGKDQPADAAAILDALDALARARAGAWVADADDGSFGFGRDSCIMHVSFADGRAAGVTFATAETPDTVYGKIDGDPAVFVAPASLRASVAGWVLDRHALVVDPSAVRAIEIGGKARDPRAKDDAGVPLADELASILTDTVHVGPPRASEGFGAKTEVRVRLFADAGRADVAFTVGAAATRGGKNVRYVRVPGIDATLSVPAAALARILASPPETK